MRANVAENLAHLNELLNDDLELLLRDINDFCNSNAARGDSIPKPLDDYLLYVAKTGNTVFPWSHVRSLFRLKLQAAIAQYQGEPLGMESSVFERFDLFRAAPFTIQRLSELITDPNRHYKAKEKYLYALEKTVYVVSTVEPMSPNEMQVSNGADHDAAVELELEVIGLEDPSNSGFKAAEQPPPEEPDLIQFVGIGALGKELDENVVTVMPGNATPPARKVGNPSVSTLEPTDDSEPGISDEKPPEFLSSPILASDPDIVTISTSPAPVPVQSQSPLREMMVSTDSVLQKVFEMDSSMAMDVEMTEIPVQEAIQVSFDPLAADVVDEPVAPVVAGEPLQPVDVEPQLLTTELGESGSSEEPGLDGLLTPPTEDSPPAVASNTPPASPPAPAIVNTTEPEPDVNPVPVIPPDDVQNPNEAEEVKPVVEPEPEPEPQVTTAEAPTTPSESPPVDVTLAEPLPAAGGDEQCS